MSLLNVVNVFKRTKSADIAKNRLHIIIAQEKAQQGAPDYLPLLRQEILKVVAKYTNANTDAVNVELHRKEHNAILELNVTLPDDAKVL